MKLINAHRGRILGLVILLGGLVGTQAIAAQTLLATTGNGSTGPSMLLEIDPVTGATLQTIGAVGYIVNGMEFDPATGKLYGSTSYRDPLHNGLIEIDLTTGAGTPIGPSGWGWAGVPGQDNCRIYSPVTNITIDAFGQMYGWLDPCADDLVSIDKSTGIATWVGASGLGTSANGLDFDLSDTLYMIQVGNVYTVDVTTGLASYSGSYPSGSCCAHHGDFDPATDLYYAIGPSPFDSPKFLEIVDVSTLTVVGTVPLADDIHVLTFADPDSDGDGVNDGEDVCPDTVIPEGVPTVDLGTNRWALVDADFEFDTTAPKGKGPGRSYSTTDTAGCSCEQIIAAQGLGKGHTKFGCSISAMDDWVYYVNP